MRIPLSVLLLALVLSTSPLLASPALDLNERGIAALKEKNFARAEELFRSANAADPANLTIVRNLAGTLLTRKNSAAAVTLLESYLANVPDDALLLLTYGDALFAQKKPVDAAAAYGRAMKINPNLPRLAEKHATTLALTDRTAEALEALERAVALDPGNTQLVANLAALLLAEGKAPQAVTVAKRALQKSATGGVYITLGTAYEMMNDRENALIAFERAKALGDTTKGLDDKIAMLKK